MVSEEMSSNVTKLKLKGKIVCCLLPVDKVILLLSMGLLGTRQK